MTELANLKVLVLDCQATHANPTKGHLLEIGWAMVKAANSTELDSTRVRTFLLGAPEDQIPSSVSRVTGITSQDLQRATPSTDVWKTLEQDIAKLSTRQQAIAVIHFARFEEPHLRHLSNEICKREVLPFRILCTHQIVTRLLPCLPRKGLRAVAGFFGHSIPEMRRSFDHLLATAFIWKQVVLLLEKDHHIQTLEALDTWLQSSPEKAPTQREYPMTSEERLTLPDRPGVYRMLRSNGDLLYVGKATSLKKRVNSYYQKRSHLSEHILEMLTQARRLDFTVTGTALEAALLEADEIKQLSPPYNIALRRKELDMVFASRDFRQIVDQPGTGRDLGPLPRSIVAPASRIIGLADKQKELTDDCLEEWGIDTRPEDAPDAQCLRLGWEMFKELYAEELSHLPQGLSKLGSALWLSRNLVTDSDDKDAETSSKAQSAWDAGKVCRLLENQVMVAVHWTRRVRWFSLLSESSIAWTPSNRTSQKRVLLVFRSGRVIHRELLPAGSEIPIPFAYRTSKAQRRKNLDQSVFDRLRVLTTELRRLNRAGCNLQIRLSPACTLDRERLARTFLWV